MAKLKEMNLSIEGMHCASCVLSLNKTFGKQEGIEYVSADLTSNKLHLIVNPKKIKFDRIQELIKNLGFQVHTDELTVKIHGMHCISCVMNIEKFLMKLDGVFDVKADLTSESAKIYYDKSKVSIEDIKNVIESLGFEVIGIDGELEVDEDEIYYKDLRNKLYRIIVGFTFSAILMILMYVKWHPFGLSMGVISLMISIVPFLYVSLPILRDGWKGIIHKNLNMDVMYSMGILVAYISSILGTFHIVLDHSFMFYETAIMLPSFLLVGRYLEAKAKKSTSDSIRKLIDLQPTNATKITLDKNGNISSEQEIPINKIKVNDIVLVRPGDKIPVDGVVINGESYVDESMINGEPIPKIKNQDSEIFAGTINQDGALQIRVSQIYDKTVLSNIIKLVEKAQNSRPPVQKIADTAVSYFIPTILTIAIIVFIIWYFIIGSTLLFALTTLISILVVACPCALGLATPTAVTVGIGRAAEYGILIKNGDTLQNAEKTNVVAFDKTGTITEGKPEVDQIIPYTLDEKQIMQITASLEKNSNHPIAKAIVKKAKEMNIELMKTEDFENKTGSGLKAKIQDDEILTGNIKLMKNENVEIDEEILIKYRNLENESKTTILLAINNKIAGIITLFDKIKPAAQKTINELHNLNITTYMLTGDNQKIALTVADTVGIDNVKANLLPENKLDIIKDIQKNNNEGKVLFVGDGINDAPALTQADIGVAMGNGTDIAMESGDIIIMGEDMENVVAAIQFSKKVMTRIKENIFWAFAYNMVLIPIAAGVLYVNFNLIFMPEWAGLAMALSSVTVISLSLLLKKYTPPIKKSEVVK